MRVKAWWLLACTTLLAALLAGCSSEPKKRVFPPEARLQQLELTDDGSWQLTLRVHNYSNVLVRFERIEAELFVDDVRAGQLALQPAIGVAANSVELLDARLTPSADAAAALRAALDSGQGSRYRLKGRIIASDPGGKYDIDFASRLDPVPGLEGVLR